MTTSARVSQAVALHVIRHSQLTVALSTTSRKHCFSMRCLILQHCTFMYLSKFSWFQLNFNMFLRHKKAYFQITDYRHSTVSASIVQYSWIKPYVPGQKSLSFSCFLETMNVD